MNSFGLIQRVLSNNSILPEDIVNMLSACENIIVNNSKMDISELCFIEQMERGVRRGQIGSVMGKKGGVPQCTLACLPEKEADEERERKPNFKSNIKFVCQLQPLGTSKPTSSHSHPSSFTSLSTLQAPRTNLPTPSLPPSLACYCHPHTKYSTNL